MDQSTLTVYGAYWCADTRLTRDYLDEEAVPYDYIELDDDTEAADWDRAQHNGTERKPTLRLRRPSRPDAVLAVPTNDELRAWLAEQQVK